MITTLLTHENILLVFAAVLITITISFTFELARTISTMGDAE